MLFIRFPGIIMDNQWKRSVQPDPSVHNPVESLCTAPTKLIIGSIRIIRQTISASRSRCTHASPQEHCWGFADDTNENIIGSLLQIPVTTSLLCHENPLMVRCRHHWKDATGAPQINLRAGHSLFHRCILPQWPWEAIRWVCLAKAWASRRFPLI